MKKRNSKKGFTLVELVIVIAVIAILAGVLIPTFGGVIDKANASAAYQEAKNAWTEYLTSVDYSKETAADDLLIVVNEGKYFVKVTDGKIDATATKVKDNNLTTAKAEFTKELLDLDGETPEVEGVFGKAA